MSLKKTTRTSNKQIAQQLIRKAQYHHARQRQEGEPAWAELSEMQRWMWIGAYVTKQSKEG